MCHMNDSLKGVSWEGVAVPHAPPHENLTEAPLRDSPFPKREKVQKGS